MSHDEVLPSTTDESDRVVPPSVNRVFNGRFEVGVAIGRGGTATVHLGRDLRSGQTVAIKVLRMVLAQDPLLRSSFLREAEVMAGLDHPAIVSIYDTGVAEGEGGSADTMSVPFIVMEHVAGRSLKDLLKAADVTLDDSIRYQVELLSALEFSHRAGIVHGDIKPANVMITSGGAVKLLDFGIARATGDPTATLSRSQAFWGTPTYFSPEQARGEATAVIGDLYSAGCVLYELLTGWPPFAGDPISLAYQHVHEEPAPAGTAIAGLDSVLAMALAKSKADRFQSARAFREALESVAVSIKEEGTEDETPHDRQRDQRTGRRDAAA